MLREDGFELVPSFLGGGELAVLQERFVAPIESGDRSVLSDVAVADFARAPKMMSLISRHIGDKARAVRAILFDKTTESNWLVPWHQDLTIVVEDRADVPGYGPWSIKNGRHHVQPPMPVMDQMLTLRLHLDDCDESNGALQVIPGSHCHGRLDADAIQNWRSRHAATLCTAKAGDALLMRPLLLHASSRATSTERRRRVLHIEFAACELAAPIRWHCGPSGQNAGA